MKKYLSGSVALLLAASLSGLTQPNPGELILASGGKSDYQIILPEQVDEMVLQSAVLMQEAFSSNGVKIPVVTEGQDDPSRPGIYIGNTRYAGNKGISPAQFRDWSYRYKTSGSDLIITGSEISEKNRYGVVKGVCDFLKEYAGTRFLFPGMTGIEFLPVSEIIVPADLDVTKEPALKFNYTGRIDETGDFYEIANNHFPGGFALGTHTWEKAVPYDLYFETHPEYFALVDGKRLDQKVRSQYCISNPEVRKLIIDNLIRQNDEGQEIVAHGQPDGFRACQCEQCHHLYGTGDDWEEKLWMFNRDIALAVQQERPGAKLLVLSYQYTTHPPRTFDSMPDNLMVLLTHTYEEALDEWSRFDVPAGYGAYLQAFGRYIFTNLLPKRNPRWLEAQARRLHGMNVQGLNPDATIYCYGLEGPAYYVWGRMWDDPVKNSAEALLEEYYVASYREAAEPMRRFHAELHRAYDLFSDWLSPRSATHFRVPLGNGERNDGEEPLEWVGVSTSHFGSRAGDRGIDDPEQVLKVIYTPELVLRMERELEQAENMAVSEKVKQRLSLVRMEFDYLREMMNVIYAFNTYQLVQSPYAREKLLDNIDRWHALLDSWYDPQGQIKTLPGWPELLPFKGVNRATLGLVTDKWWDRKPTEDNPFAWDSR